MNIVKHVMNLMNLKRIINAHLVSLNINMTIYFFQIEQKKIQKLVFLKDIIMIQMIINYTYAVQQIIIISISQIIKKYVLNMMMIIIIALLHIQFMIQRQRNVILVTLNILKRVYVIIAILILQMKIFLKE